MQYEFTCTKHNFQYGFGKMPPGDWEPALLDCPICAREKADKTAVFMAEVVEHRDMLLNVIDLKMLIQPTLKTPNAKFTERP